MRKYLVWMSLMVIVAGPLAAQTCSVSGDVNGDEAFDIADPIYLLNYLFNSGPRPECPGQTDANGDGSTDIADAVTMFSSIACANATVGDVNGNGVVSQADVDYLLEYLFLGGPEPVPCLEVADVNGDDTVDIADAVALLASLPCPGLVGDVNGSGVIALADVDYLLEYLFLGGPEPVPCLAVADVNDDGEVDIADAVALGSSLPCPGVVGDANGDEEVNIADMLVVAQSFTGGPGPVPCALAGDLNQDGRFDIADLIAYANLF